MKIAMLAPVPVAGIVPDNLVRNKYIGTEHSAPWVASLCLGLLESTDVDVRIFVNTRALRINEYECSKNGISYHFLRRPEPHLTDPYSGYLLSYIRLRKRITAYNPDVVHGFGTERELSIIPTFLPYPSVVFIQGILQYCGPYLRQNRFTYYLRKRLEKTTVKRATAIVAETRFGREWAEAINSSAIVTVIPHGYSVRFFENQPSYTSKKILCVGSITRLKGADTVVDAFLRCNTSDAELVMIGTGPMEKPLKELVAHTALFKNNRIRFAGRLPYSDILREMQTARSLVIGSRMDTSPNVVTEAHAAALPVIGTRAGGIPDMIDNGKDGLLVDVDDIDGMAAHMRVLLNEQELCHKLGQCGRERVRHVNDPKIVAAAHYDLYCRIMRSQRIGIREPS